MAGVYRMVLNFGKLRILGDQHGDKMDILEFKKERMFLEFNLVVIGDHHSIHGLTM
jgi:hypothetical protein